MTDIPALVQEIITDNQTCLLPGCDLPRVGRSQFCCKAHCKKYYQRIRQAETATKKKAYVSAHCGTTVQYRDCTLPDKVSTATAEAWLRAGWLHAGDVVKFSSGRVVVVEAQQEAMMI
jgi:hypothetical protein